MSEGDTVVAQRADVLVARARKHIDAGELRAALELLPQALAVDSQCIDAYLLIGQVGIQGGVADVAIQWLEQGAEQLPREAVVFEWLVCLYAIDGRLEDLRNCLEHYARLREIELPDAALVFARDPRISEDVRRRIAQAGDF